MVAMLQDRGIDAVLVDLSCVSNFTSHHLDQDFYDQLTDVLSSKIEECGNCVPIVTGFFGTVTGGLVNKIGRGYTDLCAALIAAGLGADALQIWKEVDGVFSANPHQVPNAKFLSFISPAEVAELTFYGSEGTFTIARSFLFDADVPSERLYYTETVICPSKQY